MYCWSSVFVTLFAAATVRCTPIGISNRQAPGGIPDYVLKYAPVVYLHSEEEYFPTDLQSFLNNVTPQVNFTAVSGPNPLTLSNVNQLGSDVYLTSKDDVTKDPEWIKGTKPDSSSKTPNVMTAAVIVNDKGNGNVDAFYMYFYAYNYGGELFKWDALNFGNHVGDWEHTMVRFKNSEPTAVWFSQHANGQAFHYRTVEKQGVRPVAYSSKGSHANYAIPGTHDHVIPNLNLPGGVLEDYTDAGTLWDPVLGAYFYSFNRASGAFDAHGQAPVEWLRFDGRWGDEEYPESDERQFKLFGQARFVGGPTGPQDKQLDREKVCPDNGILCIVRNVLVP